jgi:hypothetical protein
MKSRICGLVLILVLAAIFGVHVCVALAGGNEGEVEKQLQAIRLQIEALRKEEQALLKKQQQFKADEEEKKKHYIRVEVRGILRAPKAGIHIPRRPIEPGDEWKVSIGEQTWTVQFRDEEVLGAAEKFAGKPVVIKGSLGMAQVSRSNHLLDSPKQVLTIFAESLKSPEE